MKKIFILMFVASAFFGTSASAQKGKIEKQVLIDSLKLSDANADSVVAIAQQSMTQIRTIMKDDALSQDEKREKIKPIRDDMKTRLKQFLTEEQFQKFQEMEMARRKNRDNK